MKWFLDYTSLLLIIGSALVIGGVGFFHINAIEYWLGDQSNYVELTCGAAGLWQATRQKYF